ncbi:protein phosphatase 2C [Bacillus sp. AY3-1]|uniref:protein phosphatase 2C n=1 Tax=Bacillus sp. AY3-1 TaxID=2217817 RepID=UPI002105668E|nr:protein phosphatase 2C [Bacillus sp. AY3-1]
MSQTHREGMENMLKKLKKVMFVVIAAITLSTGFATIAPKEASAHWADPQMNWAIRNNIVRFDMREGPAYRKDVWIMMANYQTKKLTFSYEDARQHVISQGISDGSRGDDRITRDEMVGTLFQYHFKSPAWSPKGGFTNSMAWGTDKGIYDGSRRNDFANRAEVITMMYKYTKYYSYIR